MKSTDTIHNKPPLVPKPTSDTTYKPTHNHPQPSNQRIARRNRFIGIILIVAGFSMLNARYTASENTWTLFGSDSQRVREIEDVGDTTVVFGEMNIDLRYLEDDMDKGDIYVNAQTFFGTTRVIVPASWKVELNNNAILGNVANYSRGDSDGKVTLHLGGNTVFGNTHVNSIRRETL